mgnify:CR=1 FL=1
MATNSTGPWATGTFSPNSTGTVTQYNHPMFVSQRLTGNFTSQFEMVSPMAGMCARGTAVPYAKRSAVQTFVTSVLRQHWQCLRAQQEKPQYPSWTHNLQGGLASLPLMRLTLPARDVPLRPPLSTELSSKPQV